MERSEGSAAREREPRIVEVVIETTLGHLEIAVHVGRAPVSSQAFLELVDKDRFAGDGAFYRTVRKDENDHGSARIDVIQGGLQELSTLLPAVEHETTSRTGLRHIDGTISLARGAVGTATGAAFFICIGPQPALDCGGERNADGQGFAAFGQVIAGMPAVHRIHQSPTRATSADPRTKGQLLDPPVGITRVARK